MKYSLDEAKALKKLGIPDFRHMTKNKVVEFASMLPKMDPEVAKAVLQQFPNFKELASGLISEYKNAVDKAMESNKQSQDSFYKTCDSIINALQNELMLDSINSEDRSRIEEKMIEVARMVSEKDSENKKFILKIMGALSIAIGVTAAAAAAVLGSSSKLSLGDSDDNDDYNDEDGNDVIDI